MNNYTLVPRHIIENNALGNYRISLYCFLHDQNDGEGHVVTSINSLVRWLHLKPDNRDGRINESIIAAIDAFTRGGYIEPNIICEFMRRYPNETFTIAIEHKFYSKSTGYILILNDEVFSIFDYKMSNRTSPSVVLLVFSYIRLNIGVRPPDKPDAYPEAFYSYYNHIGNKLNLSRKYISNVLTIICAELELIVCKELTNRFDADQTFKWQPGLKIFANKHKYIEQENGEIVMDENYNADQEISWQCALLNVEGT